MHRVLIHHQQLVFVFDEDKGVKQRAEDFHWFFDFRQDGVDLFRLNLPEYGRIRFPGFRRCRLRSWVVYGSRGRLRDPGWDRRCFRGPGPLCCLLFFRDLPEFRHRLHRIGSDLRGRRKPVADRDGAGGLRRDYGHGCNGLFLHQLHLHRPFKRVLVLQGLKHGGKNGFIDARLVPESDFQLVGMDVHVHRFIGDREMQGAGRKLSDHDPLPAGSLHRLAQQPAVHHTAVDEKVLMVSVSASVFADAYVSADDQAVRVILNLSHRFQRVAAVYRMQCGSQLAVSR